MNQKNPSHYSSKEILERIKTNPNYNTLKNKTLELLFEYLKENFSFAKKDVTNHITEYFEKNFEKHLRTHSRKLFLYFLSYILLTIGLLFILYFTIQLITILLNIPTYFTNILFGICIICISIIFYFT